MAGLQKSTQLPYESEPFVFLGRRKAGNGLSGRSALRADANKGLVLGSRLAENDDGRKGLGVHPSYQIGVARALLFPELAHLNFGDAHGVQALTLEWLARGVNCYRPGPGGKVTQVAGNLAEMRSDARLASAIEARGCKVLQTTGRPPKMRIFLKYAGNPRKRTDILSLEI